MQITRQADYALRAMLYLSRLEPTQRASTSQIAREQRIPPSFLAKIISQLSIAGLIHTSRGARGGVTLSRSPELISILDVVEAIDGPMQLNECTFSHENCPFGEECPIRDIWCSAQQELVGRLRAANFGQFAGSTTAVKPLTLKHKSLNLVTLMFIDDQGRFTSLAQLFNASSNNFSGLLNIK